MSEAWNPGPSGAPAVRRRQSGSRAGRIVLALFAGVLAAAIGGIIWGYIAKVTGYEIGWVAIGVGFLVGTAMGGLGRSRSITLAIIGGLLAVLGCVFGRFVALAVLEVGPRTRLSDLSSLVRLTQFPRGAWELFKATLDVRDLLYVGIAAVEGFVITQRFGALRSDSGPAPVAGHTPPPPARAYPDIPGPARTPYPADPYPADPYAQPSSSFGQPDSRRSAQPDGPSAQPDRPYAQPDGPYAQPDGPYVQPDGGYQPDRPFAQYDRPFAQPFAQYDRPFSQPERPFSQPEGAFAQADAPYAQPDRGPAPPPPPPPPAPAYEQQPYGQPAPPTTEQPRYDGPPSRRKNTGPS